MNISTPPMPADGIFPDEGEEPEVLQLTQLTEVEREAYNRSQRRSSTLTNEQVEPLHSNTAQRSAQQDERTATPQPNGSDRVQTLYESAKRHFDFSEQWEMKDGTILWCRPKFDLKLKRNNYWNEARLAKNQCKRCENINATKLYTDKPIPCLTMKVYERCLLCLFEERYHGQCRAWERNNQSHSNDRHNSSYHHRDNSDEYGYSRNAYHESYYPYNWEWNRFYRDDYGQDRGRRDKYGQDRGRRKERTNERDRSPLRPPSRANSVGGKTNGVSHDMQKAGREESTNNDKSSTTPSPNTQQIQELEKQVADLRNENSILIRRCAGQLEDNQKLQEKHERSLEQKKDLEQRFGDLEQKKNKLEQMLNELYSMVHASQERMKQ